MLRRLLTGVIAGAIIALALVAVVERIAVSDEAEERRALLARNTQITLQALAPGSPLACLDRTVADGVDQACEMAVFENPQTVAAATAYVAARLAVIRAAFVRAQAGRPDLLNELAAERRGLARDRFGFAAHVLTQDYGCTATACAALAMLTDAEALKADLQSRPLDAYIARHAVTWAKPPAEAPVAALPPAPVPTIQPAPAEGSAALPFGLANAGAEPDRPTVGHPLDKRWKLPSADSIPAVSIMTPEPKLPKGDADAPVQHGQHEAKAPLPPKRPQAEAAPSAQAR